MEFTPGDAHREGEAFFPREGGAPVPSRADSAGSGSSPYGSGSGASAGDSGKAGSTGADTDGTAAGGAAWGLCSEEELQAATQRAARERLEAEVCPVDLSEYRSSADAGVLAGPADVADYVPPGVGLDAAGKVAELVPALMGVARASYQLAEGQLTGTMDDLLHVAENAERAQVFVLADPIARGGR